MMDQARELRKFADIKVIVLLIETEDFGKVSQCLKKK